MTYRWANPEHTAIRRESDGVLIPAELTNSDFRAIDLDTVEELENVEPERAPS